MNEQLPMLTQEDADDALFGEVDRDGLMIARPIEISKLWADIRQPRRVFPAEVRGDWQGSPQAVAAMLAKWKLMVEEITGLDLDMTKLVLGNDTPVIDGDSVIVNKFFRLCRLAASIVHDGLTNPITVSTGYGGYFMIETGERRWIAYHMLKIYGHHKYNKISARIIEHDIYRQASENNARDGLNAVGMARQLALILIHMYGEDEFESWNVCVSPGGCDRNYYVQAAKRDIKRGYGDQVLRATGIKNRVMVSRYRNILNLPDELWIQADDEDWPEGKCREVLHNIEQERIKKEKKNIDRLEESVGVDLDRHDEHKDDVLPVGNIDDDDPVDFKVNDRVETPEGFGRLFCIGVGSGGAAGLYMVRLDDGEVYRTENAGDLSWLSRNYVTETVVGDNQETRVKYVEIDSEGTPFIQGDPTFSAADDLEMKIQGFDAHGDLQTETVYIPDTHKDAIPLVNQERPELGKLLTALHSYYYECDDVADDQIGWMLEDLQDNIGQIENEMNISRDNLEKYDNDLKAIKKELRLYLELIAGHIDRWCDELHDIAEDYHAEAWGESDE